MSVWLGLDAILCFLLMNITGIIYYWMFAEIADSKLRLKDGLLSALLFVGNTYLSRLDYPFIHRGGSVLCTIVMIVMSSAIVFQRRGFAWGSLSLKLLAGSLMCEVIASPMVNMLIRMGIPYEKIVLGSTLDTFRQPVTAIGSLLVTIYCVTVTMCGIHIWKKYVKQRFFASLSVNKQRMQHILIYARFGMFLVVLAMIHAMYANAYYVTLEENGMIGTEYVLVTPMFFLMSAIVFSYFIQDLRYLSQLRRNDTLERQKIVSDALLSNLRSFRHNMVNMLYGFEGAILSGDRERIVQYYQEMTQRCALVNNENIVALERIVNPSVSSVVLHALDRAREEQFPCNLYVQKDIRFNCRMADSDLCEVLGVLLDNAIEAAVQAQIQFVSIEMRNADNSLEIIVKNTYSGQVTEHALRGGKSSKKEHMGQGLRSCYEILERQKAAFLNFRISGQYVQAQLLIQMR